MGFTVGNKSVAFIQDVIQGNRWVRNNSLEVDCINSKEISAAAFAQAFANNNNNTINTIVFSGLNEPDHVAFIKAFSSESPCGVTSIILHNMHPEVIKQIQLVSKIPVNIEYDENYQPPRKQISLEKLRKKREEDKAQVKKFQLVVDVFYESDEEKGANKEQKAPQSTLHINNALSQKSKDHSNNYRCSREREQNPDRDQDGRRRRHSRSRSRSRDRKPLPAEPKPSIFSLLEKYRATKAQAKQTSWPVGDFIPVTPVDDSFEKQPKNTRYFPL